MVVAHCGSRTGLNVPAGEEPDAPAATVLSNSAPPPGTTLCSASLGPVSTCLGTSENGGVVACASDFPYCLHPSGFETFVCCSGPGPINGPGGSCPGPIQECPLYRATLGADAGASGTNELCLPGAVPPGRDGSLCTVVAARLPTGTATAAQIDACARCDVPGLGAPALVGVDAWIVSPELAQYACICGINAMPQCPVAGEIGAASWCYTSQATASGCSGSALQIDAPPDSEAMIYVACFAAE
jgi:hypothetical protein